MFRTYLNILFLLLCLNSCGFHNTIINNLNSFNTKISSSGYWTLFYEQNFIYTTSFPTFSTTYSLNRKLHYLMLVYNKITNSYIITVVGGKDYKKLSEVIIKINYNEYHLPTYKDRAWLTNKTLIDSFIKDMQQGNNLIINSFFDDKTQATDTYSLKGFNEVYKELLIYLNNLTIKNYPNI